MNNDDWKQVIEEGQVFYLHKEHGNIQKLTEDSFVAMMPVVFKLGPFTTLEEAKQALQKKEEIKKLIENYEA